MSTEQIWQTISTGSDDTLRLGEVLGSNLQPPAVIELVSDLGGGKTTFTRGLAKGLGSSDVVSSPTFTLSKIYKCDNDGQLHHFDFYRLDEPGILKEQLEESLNDPKVITVIEWSDIVADVLPPQRVTINLSMTASGPDERQIDIKYSDKFAGVIKAVETGYSQSQP